MPSATLSAREAGRRRPSGRCRGDALRRSSLLLLLPAKPKREAVDQRSDGGEQEPLDCVGSVVVGDRAERRRCDRFEARRSARGDEAQASDVVGRDDSADRPAGPVDLRLAGPSTSRPRRSFPGLRHPSSSRRCGRSPARPTLPSPGTVRRPTGRRQTPVAWRNSGSWASDIGRVGKAIGGSFSASAYCCSSFCFSPARWSCQTPRPIMTATAAATTIVGMSGSLRVMARSALRGRDGHIPARAAPPWPSEARRASGAGRRESRRGAPTRAARPTDRRRPQAR